MCFVARFFGHSITCTVTLHNSKKKTHVYQKHDQQKLKPTLNVCSSNSSHRIATNTRCFPVGSFLSLSLSLSFDWNRCTVCLRNDLVRSTGNDQVSALMLLDLSWASDTVDHDVPISILHSPSPINGTAFSWFSSNLSNRSQSFIQGCNQTIRSTSHLQRTSGFSSRTHRIRLLHRRSVRSASLADDTLAHARISPLAQHVGHMTVCVSPCCWCSQLLCLPPSSAECCKDGHCMVRVTCQSAEDRRTEAKLHRWYGYSPVCVRSAWPRSPSALCAADEAAHC